MALKKNLSTSDFPLNWYYVTRITHTEQGDINITVSIGLSMLSVDEPSIDSLLKRADDALYRAKSSGRNQVVMY